MPRIRIGISGWRYKPWRGTFYPQGLPQHSELAYASSLFPSIEINGSFYSLQTPASYEKWKNATPDDFQFSVKAPRYVTHIKRLKDVATPIANFFASGVLRLEDKLGPFLWQLPPSFIYKEETLENFFNLLPRTSEDAAEMARKHDDNLRAPAWYKIDKSRRLRHALEVRHRSFETDRFINQLRRHNIALVVADTAGSWPFMEDLTAGFVYVRLHGDSELYVSGYTDAALKKWAEKFRAWSAGGQFKSAKTFGAPIPDRASGRDIYAYFDNDVKVHAPFDAIQLAELLGVRGNLPRPVKPEFMDVVTEAPRSFWPQPSRIRNATGAKTSE